MDMYSFTHSQNVTDVHLGLEPASHRNKPRACGGRPRGGAEEPQPHVTSSCPMKPSRLTQRRHIGAALCATWRSQDRPLLLPLTNHHPPSGPGPCQAALHPQGVFLGPGGGGCCHGGDMYPPLRCWSSGWQFRGLDGQREGHPGLVLRSQVTFSELPSPGAAGGQSG